MEPDREIEDLITEGRDCATARRFDEANAAFARALELGSTDSTAFYGRVFSLRNLGKYAQAQTVLDQALSLYPYDPRLAKEQGLLHYNQQRYKEAAEAFDRALIADGYDETALAWKIASLRLQRRYDEVERVVQEALELLPDSVTLLNEYGALRYDQRQYDQAVEIFDKVLAIDPNNEFALWQKIAVLRQQLRFDEADEAVQEALDRLPDNAAILNERSWLYFDQHRYGQAVVAFERVLEVDERNREAIGGKIESLLRQRRFEEAEVMIQEALGRLPNDALILIKRAFLHYDQLQYDQAIEVFDKVLALDPRNEVALELKISALRFQWTLREAEAAAREALDRIPDSVNILNERGLIQVDQYQYDQAIAAFEQVLVRDERNENALVSKISALRGKRRFEEAEAVAREALGQLPDGSAAILVERGLIHFDQELFDQADAYFAEAVDLNPYWTQSYFNRVEVLKRINRSSEALDMLRSLRQRFPSVPEVTEQLGWLYINRNDLMNAKREFQWILDEREHVAGIVGLGAVYFSQGHYEEAEGEFRRALDVAPYEPIYHTNLAWALVRQEGKDTQLDQAEKLCTGALRLDRRLAQAFGCLGIIAFKRGNLRESEDHLLNSIKVSPGEGSYSDLGALYVQMGRYGEAEEKLKKAIEINRDDTVAHVELGNLYLQTDRIKEGIPELRQAMAIDPNAEDPPRALAVALMRDGKYEEAEKVLRDAIRRLEKSKLWRLHLTLARLLIELGDETNDRQFYEEAIKEVNEAMHLKPRHPELYFHAGIARAKLEDYKTAYKDFRSCLKKDENHYEADRNARRVRAYLRDEQRIQRGSIFGGVVIGAVSTILLSVLWYAYFFTNRVTETALTVMTPVLLGLVVVAFLLPVLVRLKLPGVEAELSQPKESISSGPKGDIGFGSSPPTISSGPR